MAIARELNDLTIQSDVYNGLGNLEPFLGQTGARHSPNYEAALTLAPEAETGIGKVAYSATWAIRSAEAGNHGQGPTHATKRRSR